MGGFLLRRAGAALIVIWLASVLVFAGVRALPGDPALALGGESRDPAVLTAIRHKYGLDTPLPAQYVKWTWLALHGDLGIDSRELPVAHTIVTRLPITLELAFLAVLLGSLIGIATGVLAAWRRGRASDYAATTFAFVGLSVPHFWLGLLLIILFAVKLGWLPAAGYASILTDPWAALRYMVMPAVSLGFNQSALIARIARSCMVEVLQQDYIRTARAKGLPNRIVAYVHGFRNALVPVVTVIGVTIAILVGGAVVTEIVFNIPGMGRLIISAILRRDYPVVQGVVLVTAASYVLINLAVDMVYAFIDPRIRYD
jgi:peptide/nickel transport system permease protein